jgi:hypothetical protein
MKITTIILILIIVLVLYYLYLNTEKFTQESNKNIETYSPESTETPSYISDITGTPGIYTPSLTPSSLTNSMNTIFKLNLDYDYYAKNILTKNNTINQLLNELSTVLSASKNRFTITSITPGSIVVNLTFNKINSRDPITLANDNMTPNDLYNLLISSITNTRSSLYQQTILKNIDTSYGVINESNQSDNLSPITSQINTILDKLTQNNYPFALSVTIPTVGIYPPDMANPPEVTNIKLYLTVANKTEDYSSCTSLSGMLSLQPTLTKGGVFTLNSQPRSIPKNTYPYKYIDFYNVVYDVNTSTNLLQSAFYGLQLYNTPNLITHCAEGCEDNTGFCAQETSIRTKYAGTGLNDVKNTDIYNIKNLLKFVIEGDSSTSTTVTPYFVSLNPEESIRFITNQYNTLYDPNMYKSIIQVPIYEKGQRPYYKEPQYINPNTPSSNIKFTTVDNNDSPASSITYAPSLDLQHTPSSTKLMYQNIIIKNLEPILKDIDTDSYARQNKMSIQETQVTKNDAYINFALKFNVEILTQEEVDGLPM